MELVLGLAALATAISSVGGANHVDSSPDIVEAESTTVQTMDGNPHQYEIQETLPESHLTEFDDSIADKIGIDKIRDIVPEKKPHPTSIPEKENNNSVAKANNVGQYMALYSDWDFSNYSADSHPHIASTTMSGTISKKSDVDWFYFELYGKADIHITLTRIAADCNYNITLYKWANIPHARKNEVVEIASSKNKFNYDEEINVPVYPGVYYVKVDAEQGYGATEYRLYCSASYHRSYYTNEEGVCLDDVCIEDLMDGGAKAALWLSDYDPFGITPSSNLNTHDVGYEHDEYDPIASLFFDKDEYNPEFPFVINKAYKQAELFVWDINLRNDLSVLAQALYDEANKSYQNAINLYKKIQQGEAIFDILMNLAGELGGDEVSWGITGASIAMDLMTLFCPEGNRFEHYTDMKSYFLVLARKLACTSYSSGLDVIRIPIRYSIRNEHLNMGHFEGEAGDETYIPDGDYDWYTLTYEPYVEAEPYYDYTDGGKVYPERRYIHTIDHEGESPFSGNIFPIVLGEDVDRAFKYRIARKLPKTELVLDDNVCIERLNEGQCLWFSFTAPHDGNYKISSSGDSFACLEVFNEKTTNTDPNYLDRAYRTPGCYCGFSYNFALEEGETLWFRLGARDPYDLDNYCSLYQTNIVVTEVNLEMQLSIWPSDLGLDYEWDNSYRYNTVNTPGYIDVESRGAFIHEDSGFIELKVERDGVCGRAHLILMFDRPIKSISYSSAIGNGWSYAALQLHVCGLDEDRDAIVNDADELYNSSCAIYGDYYLNRYEHHYKTEERDVGYDIYGVNFILDPATDQSPYHVGYQEQWITDITVEFAD